MVLDDSNATEDGPDIVEAVPVAASAVIVTKEIGDKSGRPTMFVILYSVAGQNRVARYLSLFGIFSSNLIDKYLKLPCMLGIIEYFH